MRMKIKALLSGGAAAFLMAGAPALAQDEAPPVFPAQIIADAPEDVWRPLDPENTLYMDL